MQRAAGGPPRYVQLAAEIRAQILSGALGPGDRVPGEPELVETRRVSKTTAGRALQILADEGLITRRSGAGTFVAEHVTLGVQVITAPAGARVSARWPRPGDLPGAPPGTIALVVQLPGAAEALYPADRASVLFA